MTPCATMRTTATSASSAALPSPTPRAVTSTSPRAHLHPARSAHLERHVGSPPTASTSGPAVVGGLRCSTGGARMALVLTRYYRDDKGRKRAYMATGMYAAVRFTCDRCDCRRQA